MMLTIPNQVLNPTSPQAMDQCPLMIRDGEDAPIRIGHV
jgi:hypothetical protein